MDKRNFDSLTVDLAKNLSRRRLLGRIAGRAGEVVVFPLWAGQGRDASRVLVRARKQIAAPARLAAGLVLHEADGRFTAAAEAILREASRLEL